MDTLKNKRYDQYSYKSRYLSFPYYYDTLSDKDLRGIGKQVNKNVTYVTHTLKPTDTLDSLALKYYNNPSFWWAIAYFNDIQDAFMELMPTFSAIKIPNLYGIEFKNER